MIKVLFILVFLLSSCDKHQEPDRTNSAASSTSSEPSEKIRSILHKASEGAVYFGAGSLMGSASLVSRLAWGVSLISPWSSTTGNECLLLSDLLSAAARHVFSQLSKNSLSPNPSFLPKNIKPSQSSWYLNQKTLSQIPANSEDDKKLLLFLEKHWLAKSSGFFSSVVDWACPCFGFSVQVHPDTTSTYARNPGKRFSQTYRNRVEAWKEALPQPHDFPLLLTRPFGVQEYLPARLEVASTEDIPSIIEQAAFKLNSEASEVVIDLTQAFSKTNEKEEWTKNWKSFCDSFSEACKDRHLNPNQFVCVQRMKQEAIGGIRILPLTTQLKEAIDHHHQFLLDRISHFGLTANRIELDRWPLQSNTPQHQTSVISIEHGSKEEIAAFLSSYDQNWSSRHPQKTLMVKGTLQVLKGLLESISQERWDEIQRSPTLSSVAQLSFSKIKEQLIQIADEEKKSLFFDTASRVEQIHGHLSSLLEVFSPFTREDFSSIYSHLLTVIPTSLKPLASFGIHSSAMTNLAGIFKAVEETIGRPARLIYGENTYFECVDIAKEVTQATPAENATEEDWREVDLMLAQFNPILKVGFQATSYRSEKIAENLHKALNARQSKPLTVAVDCTLDFINSPRLRQLIEEFQEEIKNGSLNFICFQSGLKFDLFGMDNYCGAPIYMINNHDSKWDSFQRLLTDPALLTDRLSVNWFCLAYQYAAPYLEDYRKQIFDNTRSLLDKIPPSLLYTKNAHYRITPVEKDADPAFIDIKVFGPFHKIRASALVGGCLYLKCMEKGHPVFYRPSLGFYHTNFYILFDENSSTIRLTLGLDPSQVDILAGCFKMIDALNGSSHKEINQVQNSINLPYPTELQPTF